VDTVYIGWHGIGCCSSFRRVAACYRQRTSWQWLTATSRWRTAMSVSPFRNSSSVVSFRTSSSTSSSWCALFHSSCLSRPPDDIVTSAVTRQTDRKNDRVIDKSNSSHSLLQGSGYAISSVCMSFFHSFCLSVSKITAKVIMEFCWNLVGN